MSTFDLVRAASPEQLAATAARFWLEELAASNRDRFCVALSGGRIARLFFQAAARLALGEPNRFDCVDFFWADERCVPPTDPESNYGLARQHLLAPLAVPAERTHRIAGELEPPAAAQLAAAELRRVAPVNSEGVPILDLIFLGMGEDGHVASIFPGDPLISSSRDFFRPVVASKPPPQRITMGLNVISAARQVWVLASGEGKVGAFAEALSSSGKTPLARVVQARTATRIFTELHEKKPAAAA